MKSDLDHLPERQQQELERVRSTLLTEFEAARTRGAGGTSEWRKVGRVLKIVLFGSYARNDWVDAPENGYVSDFDILVVVTHQRLTDIADYWWAAEDAILHDPSIGRMVNLIVHDLADVNASLKRGEYFWADLYRDGIVLYELPGHPLTTPQPTSPTDAYTKATAYFENKSADIGDWMRLAELSLAQGSEEVRWRRKAAFNLHRAVEAAYACMLLVHTFYFPRSHNIKFLRSLAEAVDQRLVEAWPRTDRMDRRRFELLKRAYVEARYSDHYDVSPEDLRWLFASVECLRDLVAVSGEARLQALRQETDQAL